MSRCLVTGGSGFIGSHVVDELIESGHQVLVLDYAAQPHRDDVEFFEANLTDADRILDASRNCDYIFHLGAVADLNAAVRDPALCAQVNVLGTINILEAARRNEVKRVILASSVWIYSGSPRSELKENDPFYSPKIGPFYSSSKIAAELFCHEYSKEFAQPFTILRYGTPFGPRMREPLAVHSFITKVLANEPITIWGNGTQSRQFIYVQDLARAHCLVLSDKGTNKTFNIAGSQMVTITEMVNAICTLLGKQVKIVYEPARSNEEPIINVSIAKVKEELGWEPKVTLEEGLKKTIDWYRTQVTSS